MERDGLQTFMNQAKHRILTGEEERSLARRAQAGDRRAHDELVLHNIRLVYSIARRYVPGPLPLDDLMQEGTLGLIRAVEKFDPDRGFKLSTYATWWIKQAVQRAIHGKGRVIRLPTHVAEQLDRMRRHETKLEVKLGRKPTDDELSKSTGLTVAQIDDLRQLPPAALSLDAFVHDDGTPADVAEMGVVDRAEESDDFAVELARRDELEKALRTLTDRQREVVMLRFADGLTFQEIGDQLGLTRERVRQITGEALKRLAHRVAA